jgi:integrase/recombinase XerD
MKRRIGNQRASSRTPEGPIAPHIGSFEEFLGAQGYALSSIHRQVLLAACLSRWLKQEGVELHRIISDHSRRYLRYRAREIKPCLGDAAALKHLLEFLRGEELIPAEPVSVPQLTPVERYTTAYAQHLREARALAEATIHNYVPFIDSFLKGRFADGPVALSDLCARDVVAFVQRQAPRLQIKRAKLMTSALRSFLKPLFNNCPLERAPGRHRFFATD